MNKEKYMELYDRDENIDLTDEDIVEWLDGIVNPIIELSKNDYSLCWGVLEDGNYSSEICVCRDDKRLHIFSGIDMLAKAVGETLTYRKRDDDEYPHEYSFEYKGVHIFEIRRG